MRHRLLVRTEVLQRVQHAAGLQLATERLRAHEVRQAVLGGQLNCSLGGHQRGVIGSQASFDIRELHQSQRRFADLDLIGRCIGQHPLDELLKRCARLFKLQQGRQRAIRFQRMRIDRLALFGGGRPTHGDLGHGRRSGRLGLRPRTKQKPSASRQAQRDNEKQLHELRMRERLAEIQRGARLGRTVSDTSQPARVASRRKRP